MVTNLHSVLLPAYKLCKIVHCPGRSISTVFPCSCPPGYTATRAVVAASNVLLSRPICHYCPLPTTALLVLAVLRLRAHRGASDEADVGGIPHRPVDIYYRRSALCRQCTVTMSRHTEQRYSSQGVSARWQSGHCVNCFLCLLAVCLSCVIMFTGMLWLQRGN